jgi:hypothetical protein
MKCFGRPPAGRMDRRRAAAALLLAAAVAALSGCAASGGGALPATPLRAAYVVVGEGGTATARAITGAPGCPDLRIDGAAQPMRVRAEPGTAPARPRQAKPAEFAVRVCEASLPPGDHEASVDGQALPAIRTQARRIVVLGDTGCRIKTAEKAYQDCSDPRAWPFAAVAGAAAAERPDLVVHVGDYHYRESACPAGEVCAGSPWGYGWDAWDADLFAPGRQLLAAAPWVVVRGNHEECARAGQGWFRLLAPEAYSAARSCDRPQDDADADFSRPYAVPLDAHWQLIVFDSARASRPPAPDDPSAARALEQYRGNLRTVAALASVPGMHSMFVSHHPVLGFSIEEPGKAKFGNPMLLAAMGALNGGAYFPAQVDAALHGHVHAFEAIGFSSAHPATLVAGHGGDLLDRELPDAASSGAGLAEGVRVDFFAHARQFGYLVLDRDTEGWTVHVRRADGGTLGRCLLRATKLRCEPGLPGLAMAGRVPDPAPAEGAH